MNKQEVMEFLDEQIHEVKCLLAVTENQNLKYHYQGQLFALEIVYNRFKNMED